MGLFDLFRRAGDTPSPAADPGHAADLSVEAVGKAVQLGFDGKPMRPGAIQGGWSDGDLRGSIRAGGAEASTRDAYDGGGDWGGGDTGQ